MMIEELKRSAARVVAPTALRALAAFLSRFEPLGFSDEQAAARQEAVELIAGAVGLRLAVSDTTISLYFDSSASNPRLIDAPDDDRVLVDMVCYLRLEPEFAVCSSLRRVATQTITGASRHYVLTMTRTSGNFGGLFFWEAPEDE